MSDKFKGKKGKAGVSKALRKKVAAKAKSVTKAMPGKLAKENGAARSILVEGKIDASGKGYGFLVREDCEEDAFVSARDMNTALGGDRVLAEITPDNRGGQAKVVKILERANVRVVGTYRYCDGVGIVVPDNRRLGSDIYIKDRTAEVADGEKVVAEIVDYPPMRRPGGKITEVLGFPEDPGVDILSVIRAHDLYEEFPHKVLAESEKVPLSVPASIVKTRKDYRDEPIVTIDGDDSRDFDDAVTLSKRGNEWRLGVHIADVAEYVRAGSELDKEAFKRGTSVYFPDRVLPMLPERLSNGICSLNEGEDRLTLSVIMYIDNLGNVTRHKIREGVIRSHARLTYSGVAALLGGDTALREKYRDLVPMLEDMKLLAELLRNKRTQRGNIEFDIPECKIVLDENGRTTDVVKSRQLVSHKIIEEFMLLCNETVAEHFAALKTPFVYRAHAAPPPEKVQTLVGFASALGLTFRGSVDSPKSEDFARFLASLEPQVAGVVNRVALRSMSKATYEPHNVGHFGLAAPYYCHFTSPIRRYPDLMIHRIIKTWLHGENVDKFAAAAESASRQSSDREKLAESAERKVDDLKKAEFMQDKIGQKFVGTVSGVTEWGIFVELENTVEGLIRTENLPGGGYVFNPELFRTDGPSRSFKLGDELKIVVSGVSGDRVSFELDE